MTNTNLSNLTKYKELQDWLKVDLGLTMTRGMTGSWELEKTGSKKVTKYGRDITLGIYTDLEDGGEYHSIEKVVIL